MVTLNRETPVGVHVIATQAEPDRSTEGEIGASTLAMRQLGFRLGAFHDCLDIVDWGLRLLHSQLSYWHVLVAGTQFYRTVLMIMPFHSLSTDTVTRVATTLPTMTFDFAIVPVHAVLVAPFGCAAGFGRAMPISSSLLRGQENIKQIR